jgi:hypothetical protein
MIVPKYDEDWVFEKLSWDMDPSSQEPCMEDDKGEVDFGGDSAHESHHLTGQCMVSKYCMASSSESVVVDGDSILIDENKSENLLCDNPYHLDEIEQSPLALHDLEDQLLVTKEKIVQVLTREDGAHRFIETLIWKTQMEERQKGVASGVTSAQLHIIKEALEQMKLITCSCSWIGTFLLSSLKTRKGRLRSFVTN